jgi:uncharacterized membrane protein YeiH
MNLQNPQFSEAFNIGAVFFFALTGALAARRLGYDIIGVFVLAFVTGLGGGLIRDSLLRGSGPVAALTDPLFMVAVLCATLCGLFRFSSRIESFNRAVAVLDAIGLGAFAVVGTEKAMRLELHWLAAIFVGVVNAVGGGLLRDLLIRAEPLLLKPGQFYAFAALIGAATYAAMTVHWKLPVIQSAIYATLTTVLFRVLAIVFNWKTRAVEVPIENP